MKVEFLILGGGIAGVTAAETLRKLRPEAKIGLVSQEDHPLYSRVLLPHYIKEKVSRERVFLRADDNLLKLNIQTWINKYAAAINTAAKTVTLDGGEEIGYGKLLIATGGRATSDLKSQISNSHFFRTIEDADDIIKTLSALPPGSLCAALGSSFIALEFPPIFAHFGMKTEVVMRGPGFFHSVLDAESMNLIEEIIKEHEGTILKNSPRLTGALEAKFTGIGLGMKMNLDFALLAGAEVNTGLLTNEYLETNLPDIWAAGDISEFWDPIFGKRRSLGNWMNAEMQGRVAAINISGEKVPFRMVSSYATRIFDLTISFIGDVSLDANTQIVKRGSAISRSLTRIMMRNNKIVGATLLGDIASRGPLVELIKKGAEIGDIRALEDKSFDLKNLA